MRVLPDHLTSGLRVVIVDTAVGDCAADRGHHHVGAGDDFWRLLHESGLTPTRLRPQDDAALPDWGIGLVSVVKVVPRAASGPAFDVPPLLAALEQCAPAWVALHGKVVAAALARAGGHAAPGLGRTPWPVAGHPAFVLPSSSGANRRRDYDGRPTRLDWWAELAGLATDGRGGRGPARWRDAQVQG